MTLQTCFLHSFFKEAADADAPCPLTPHPVARDLWFQVNDELRPFENTGSYSQYLGHVNETMKLNIEQLSRGQYGYTPDVDLRTP